jgi:plastocyanin
VRGFLVIISTLALASAAAVVAPAGALAANAAIGFPTDPAAGAYTPGDVTVDPGNTVTFNGSFTNHPLVWTRGDFATQSSGTTNTYTFTQPGLYRFHCQIHASMTGSVLVTGDQLGTPDFTWGPAQPRVAQVVTFHPTAFTDPDGSVASYLWDLDGNGSFETTGAAPTHAYNNAGTVDVGLAYVDDRGETSPATRQALVIAPAAGAGGGTGGGGTTTPGGGGGTGGGSGGTPIQPGAPGSPFPGTTAGPTPAGGAQGAGPSSGGQGATRLRIGTRALAFRSGRARIAVSGAPSGRALTARLTRRGVTLASGRARARARTITITLTAAGRRALRSGRALSATLTIAAGKTATARKTLRARA